MKRINMSIDERYVLTGEAPDEDVQAIVDWFKKADVIEKTGYSVKPSCSMGIDDCPNPKPHPTDEPTRKGLKLVPFLKWR